MPIPAMNNPTPPPSLDEWILRYETAAMAKVRQILTDEDVISDNQVDTFKSCLSMLEGHGFRLIGPDL